MFNLLRQNGCVNTINFNYIFQDILQEKPRYRIDSISGVFE